MRMELPSSLLLTSIVVFRGERAIMAAVIWQSFRFTAHSCLSSLQATTTIAYRGLPQALCRCRPHPVIVPFYRSLMSFISPSNDDHRLPWLTPGTLQVQTPPGHAASRATARPPFLGGPVRRVVASTDRRHALCAACDPFHGRCPRRLLPHSVRMRLS
jgi:hypothetical protein